MNEITPRDFLIGSIIFMLIIVGGINIVSSMNNEYSGFISNDNLKKFKSLNKTSDLDNQITKFNSTLETIESASDQNNPIFASFGFLGGLVQGVWAVFSNMVESFSFLTSLFGELDDLFGIPQWIISLITSLIVGILIFGIYSLIFNRTT